VVCISFDTYITKVIKRWIKRIFVWNLQ
jgi:hypothetical protein